MQDGYWAKRNLVALKTYNKRGNDELTGAGGIKSVCYFFFFWWESPKSAGSVEMFDN